MAAPDKRAQPANTSKKNRGRGEGREDEDGAGGGAVVAGGGELAES